MIAPTSSSPGETSQRSTIHALIDQLRPPNPWKPRREWIPYGMALGYGFIAFLMGAKFAMVYGGLLAVVIILHNFAEERNRRQIELLIRIAEELEKKGRDRAA